MKTRLRANAKIVKKVLSAPGSNFAYTGKQKSGAIVEELALPPYQGKSLDDLQDSVTRRSLGAMEELRRQNGVEVLREAGFLESTRKFARLLHLGQMTALASFYFDFLWTVMDYRPALDDLVEVLLDLGVELRALPLPARMPGKPEDRELFEYATSRNDMLQGREPQAFEDLVVFDPAKAPPRLVVALADASLEMQKPTVPFEILCDIVRENPEWRYASATLIATLAAREPKTSTHPVELLSQFLSGFGNQFSLWYAMARYAPKDAVWRSQMDALLAREVASLQHNRMAWTSLAQRVSDASPEVVDEVNARVADQARAL